jgi:hypothetical protein
MITAQTTGSSRPRGRTVLINWLPTILMNVVLPLFTYFLLEGWGWSAVPALLISGAWPALETLVMLAVSRRLDEIGVLALIFVALGVVAGLGFGSARLVLVKESLVTGLFGVVLLASLLLPRPVMFYFGRKFATDGTAEGLAYWNGLWRYPSFRRTQRVISVVWGVAFLAEAGLRVALSYALSTSVMAVVSTILPLAATAGLVTWTVSYGRRARAAALAAHPATDQPEVASQKVGSAS